MTDHHSVRCLGEGGCGFPVDQHQPSCSRLARSEPAAPKRRKFDIWVTNAESGFNVLMQDADAQAMNLRYDIKAVESRSVIIAPFQRFEGSYRRGVRPGKPIDRKRQGDTVRYMQFEPADGLPLFSIVPATMEEYIENCWAIELPEVLPLYNSRSGSKHHSHPSPTPNPDPIPAPEPSLTSMAPAIRIGTAFPKVDMETQLASLDQRPSAFRIDPSEATSASFETQVVGVIPYRPDIHRISIRDAVARVNAFLAETDGAEPELYKFEGQNRLRITVVETYD